MRKKRPNLLANRTITVGFTRNGLSFEVANVPALDGAMVAKALMDGVRGLIAAGYDELVIDGSAYHSANTDQPEELDDPDFVLPPVGVPKTQPSIGFR